MDREAAVVLDALGRRREDAVQRRLRHDGRQQAPDQGLGVHRVVKVDEGYRSRQLEGVGELVRRRRVPQRVLMASPQHLVLLVDRGGEGVRPRRLGRRRRRGRVVRHHDELQETYERERDGDAAPQHDGVARADARQTECV